MKTPALTEDAKALLLICCPLTPKSTTRPLSLTEYNRLAMELFKENKRPANLLEDIDLRALALRAGLQYENQLEDLLALRGKLGFILEEWQQRGLWIVSRADDAYPKQLKRHLTKQAPPILFGIGDASILQKGGLGIVGSRNVDKEGAAYARKTAQMCAEVTIPVISGGARGVDRIAMCSAAEHGGAAVGFVADSLLTMSHYAEFRDYIADELLVLLSPYNPKAGFSVGAAMGRNKLIYAQSNYSLVISSDLKGGTWTGATEELKRPMHRTIFVRDEPGVPEGNKRIIQLGGIPWPELSDTKDFKQRLMDAAKQMPNSVPQNKPPAKIVSQGSLFSIDKAPAKKENATNNSTAQIMQEKPSEIASVAEASVLEQPKNTLKADTTSFDSHVPSSIFEAILPVLCKSLHEPLTAKELASELDVGLGQMQKWLERAISENILKKVKGRYHLIRQDK